MWLTHFLYPDLVLLHVIVCIIVWENDKPMLMVFWFIQLTNSAKVLTVCLTARAVGTWPSGLYLTRALLWKAGL